MPNQYETGSLIKKVARIIFPVLTIIFVALYLIDEPFYRSLIREDSIAEWLTFTLLISAGLLSGIIAYKINHRYNYLHSFFIGFCAFNLLAGMEEISWGQRVADIPTTGIFHKYSDQNEINLHNTFQGIFKIKTKHIALLILLVYGFVLPGIYKGEKTGGTKFPLNQLIIPPRFLRAGFFLASILMLDFQTGHEEEIGEMFFSLCFFLMMLWNYTKLGLDTFRQFEKDPFS